MARQREAKPFEFWASIKKAFMTVPAGLKKMFGIGAAGRTDNSLFADALKNHFDGQIGAFAYLLFVLLYFPCIATTATAYRETNRSWAVFMVGWSTSLAYLTATLFYQLATYADHPGTTIAWLIGSIAVCGSVVIAFHYLGVRGRNGVTGQTVASQ